MKQKIIERLKALLQTWGVKNLSTQRIDAIADKLSTKITDEADIDGKLTELNEITPFADMAKDDDRYRSLEAKLKKPATTTQATDDPPKPGDDTPEWAKALIQSNQQMAQKIADLEAGRTQESNMNHLLGILKEKKIPESYYKVAIAGRTFKDTTEVESFANTIVEGYGQFDQQQTNEGLKNQPAPLMGVVKDPDKEVSPMMQSYLKDKEEKEKK